MAAAVVAALGHGQVEVGSEIYPVERVALEEGAISFSAGSATFRLLVDGGVRPDATHIVLKVRRIQILTTRPAQIGCEIGLAADGATPRTAYCEGRIVDSTRLKLQWRASGAPIG